MKEYEVPGNISVTITEETAARIAKEWLWNRIVRKSIDAGQTFESACYEAEIILEPFFKES